MRSRILVLDHFIRPLINLAFHVRLDINNVIPFAFFVQAHLSPANFRELFGMSIESFYAMPKWKQIRLRKEAGLF